MRIKQKTLLMEIYLSKIPFLCDKGGGEVKNFLNLRDLINIACSPKCVLKNLTFTSKWQKLKKNNKILNFS